MKSPTNDTSEQKSSLDTDKSRKVSRFFRRMARFTFIGTSTLLFPLTMIAVGAVNLHASRNDTSNLLVKIKDALKSMMYPVPLIGPLLACMFCDQVVIGGGVIFNKHDMNHNEEYLLACIPFLGTCLASSEVDEYLFGKLD